MGLILNVDGVFTVNSVDLTDHTTEVMVEINASEKDLSTITDPWDVIGLGRKGFAVSFTMLDDFAASSVDITLWTAFDGGIAVPFTARKGSGAISSTNPELQGNILPGKTTFGGPGGEYLKKALNWKGTGTLTRDITP